VAKNFKIPLSINTQIYGLKYLEVKPKLIKVNIKSKTGEDPEEVKRNALKEYQQKVKPKDIDLRLVQLVGNPPKEGKNDEKKLTKASTKRLGKSRRPGVFTQSAAPEQSASESDKNLSIKKSGASPK
jgi:hypothetical protein